MLTAFDFFFFFSIVIGLDDWFSVSLNQFILYIFPSRKEISLADSTLHGTKKVLVHSIDILKFPRNMPHEQSFWTFEGNIITTTKKKRMVILYWNDRSTRSKGTHNSYTITQEFRLWGQDSGIWILVPPFTTYVTLGKYITSLNLFPHPKAGATNNMNNTELLEE